MRARNAKSLIMTYHRITDDDAVTGFYDVPVSRFRQHVARIAACKGDLRVVITFDDGTRDHLRAAHILADLGLRGVFFLVLDRLNQPGYLDERNVADLVDLNQIVGSHTVTHRQLPTLSDKELRRELAESRTRLEALSDTTIDWFAPPGGHYDRRSLSVARATGYRFVRTMDWGYAPSLDSPVDALLPTVPMLRNVSDRRLEDLLSGRATFTGFAVKQAARRLLPPKAYARLRDWTISKGNRSHA